MEFVAMNLLLVLIFGIIVYLLGKNKSDEQNRKITELENIMSEIEFKLALTEIKNTIDNKQEIKPND